MKKLNYKLLFATLLANCLFVANTWAERILISDGDQTVSLNGVLDCYRAADITIDTSRPEIYEPGSTQLQVVGDTVRAMLNYECPQLSEINITGLVRGLRETVYQGSLTQRNNWLVKPIVSDTLGQIAPYDSARSNDNWRTTLYDTNILSDKLTVTDLELGMTVAEVSKIVTDTFKVVPQYDADQGLMTMRAGGCPSNFDASRYVYAAKPNWKCLKAWFSDKRIARLDRLELVQVLNTDSDNVQQLLVEKYGHPSESKITKYNKKAQLIWRAKDESSTEEQDIQALSAVVSKTKKNLVVTNLTLFKEAVSEDVPVSYADVDLRL